MKLYMKKFFSLITLFCLVFLFTQCGKNLSDSTEKKSNENTIQNPTEGNKNPTVKDSVKKEAEKIKFSSFVFPKKKKDSAMSAFMEKYSKEERYVILALNRLDNKNRWRADTLIIPEKIETDFLKYSPFPYTLSSLKEVKKMVFFSYDIHAYALYENGNLVKWGPSSLGKKSTPTKTGLMFTNWKKEEAISTSNSEWLLRWNFNIHNTAGIGWHQYDLPGFHASHSCLRLLEEDAKWMYNWADTWVLTNQGQTVKAKGTPVIVFGTSDFKTRPWLKLLENPAANDYNEEQMNKVFVSHLDEILKEQQNSENIKNSQPQKHEETENKEV